jgi:hypothetical protein
LANCRYGGTNNLSGNEVVLKSKGANKISGIGQRDVMLWGPQNRSEKSLRVKHNSQEHRMNWSSSGFEVLTVVSVKSELMFRMNVLPPSSGLKIKLKMELPRKKQQAVFDSKVEKIASPKRLWIYWAIRIYISNDNLSSNLEPNTEQYRELFSQEGR